MPRIFIGLGGNLGDRSASLGRAERAMDGLEASRVVAVSPVYETEPVGPISQGRFLNAVAELDSGLNPPDLLKALLGIESDCGRRPSSRRPKGGPRTLDLDLLLYDDRVVEAPDLSLPHPQMHQRWFVLKPLCDLDPSVVHPVLNRTAGQLLADLEDRSGQARQKVGAR